MDAEKPLSAEDSINIIMDAIGKTKENIKENSFYFLLWGWVVSIASFSFFLLQRYTSFPYFFLPFPVLGSIALTITVIYYLRNKSTTTQTYFGYFLSRLWMVLAVCFITVVFINVSRKLPPFTDTLIIACIGTLVSGWVMKFQPLIIGGIVFLISAIVSIYIPDEYKALLHGVAIVIGYLIPGYLLKKQHHDGGKV
ncbi:MAG TPA: hypothetical protein VK543_14630 [Puia sp.]|nr:hypothetical protein [Puia sp.]